MTLGEEWYQAFWDGYQIYTRTHKRQWDLTTSDKKWSEFMFEFLTGLAHDMGFEEAQEEAAFNARKLDRVWRRNNETVVLEHENWGVNEALKDEVPKLARTRADLHVCITYVPAGEFPGGPYARRCTEILERERFKGEFLLILGTYDLVSPTDWACYKIIERRELKEELIMLPSSGRGASRRRKGGRDSGWEGMKRAYPSSRAVAKALHKAASLGFSDHYVQQLEGLRRYWEKRGN